MSVSVRERGNGRTREFGLDLGARGGMVDEVQREAEEHIDVALEREDHTGRPPYQR